MAKITPIEMVSTKPYIKKTPMDLLSVLSQLLSNSCLNPKNVWMGSNRSRKNSGSDVLLGKKYCMLKYKESIKNQKLCWFTANIKWL